MSKGGRKPRRARSAAQVPGKARKSAELVFEPDKAAPSPLDFVNRRMSELSEDDDSGGA